MTPPLFGKWGVSIRHLGAYMPLLALVTVALLIAAIGTFGFQRMYQLIEDNQVQNLGAIADMKVQQIVSWRKAQLLRGEFFSKSAMLPDVFNRWLEDETRGKERQQKLLQLLHGLQEMHGYKAITLFDRGGTPRISTTDLAQDGDDLALAMRVMAKGKVEMLDIHRSYLDPSAIRIDLAAPLLLEDARGTRVVGAVVFQIDPHTFLYPLMSTWPSPSASAETLLVRREGGEVLFLNMLRHRNDPAMTLHLPLASLKMPAARAVLGETQARDGVDYRGVPVVAVMRHIPGSDWFMVSKIDTQEIFAPVQRLKDWSLGLGLAFMAIGGFLVFFWLRANQARIRHLGALHQAAVEREMLVRHFEYLTRYANDMILVANEQGRIIEANERALEALGYRRDELLNMRIVDLHVPGEAAMILERVDELLRLGALRVEGNFLRKDGRSLPVEISARVIEVQGVRYLQGIVRDIAERKAAEDALRKSGAMLAESQRLAQIGSWDLDLQTEQAIWSEETRRIFELPASFGGTYRDFFEYVHPDDRDRVDKAYTESVRNHTPFTLVHRLLLPDQRVKYVQVWCETLYDPEGRPLRSVGTTQDITERYLVAEALEQQKKFMRQVLDTDPSLIFVKDEQGRLLLANQAMALAHGMTPEQMLERDDPGFGVSEEERAREIEIERQVRASRQQAVTITRLRTADRNDRWFLVIRALMEQADGAAHLLGIAVDMTENIRAADLVRKSAEKIEDLYNNAPCGYHSLDSDGYFVRLNNTELQWLGYERDEVVGRMRLPDMMAPASRAVFERTFPVLKQTGMVRDLELDLVRKDGSPLPVLLNATAIYDEQGQFLMSRSTLVDISAHRQTQKQLTESEERFRVMADNAPIMIWMVDASPGQGRRRRNFFNKGWYDFTGLSDEQSQGLIWRRLVHPDDWQRCQEAYLEAFRESRPFKLECRLLRRDGTYRWVEATGIPRRTEDGHFLGYIGTCTDITEQKLFDVLRAEVEHVGRLNIAGEMASGLAHELSQPLSAANIYLDACLSRMALADSEADSGKLQEVVQLAKGQTERAGKIVSHLRDLIRKQGQERALLDINLLISDTLGFLEYELQQHGITVVDELSQLPPVRVNKVEIEQVLINLIKNAVDSMASSAQRELSLCTEVLDSGIVLVTVGDTGKGIAAHQLDQVFHPFQTTKESGLGLGLTICRTLIENHGGRIWVEPHGECGSEFKFVLPVEAAS